MAGGLLTLLDLLSFLSSRRRMNVTVTVLTCLLLVCAQHAAAQGRAGRVDVLRGAQQCMAEDLLQRDVLLSIASKDSGKGGGSGGRGSPMLPPDVIRHLTVPAVYGGASSSGRRLLQERDSSSRGASANRDVAPVQLQGCGLKNFIAGIDRILHTFFADEAYQGPKPWVSDQGRCSSCVTKTFAKLAEASVAARLGIHPRSLTYNYSDTYPHYCGETTGYRACESEMHMGTFVNMMTDHRNTLQPCLKMSDVFNFGDVPDACEAARRHCKADDAPGPSCFPLQPLNQADVQRYIRTFGGVATTLDIPNSTAFKEFFERQPTGTWSDTSSCEEEDIECQKLTYHHTVMVTGYNNTDGTYTVHNSWSTGFANDGTFQIRQGVGAVGLPSQTWGMVCYSGLPADDEAVLARTAHVVPLPDEPGCYNHTVNTSNTPNPSVLATLLDISIGGMLLNNTPAPIPLMNVTFVGSAAAGECPSGPTCGSNQTSPICVLEVTHDQLTGNCTVTAHVPAKVNWEGLTLKVCIPGSTFREYRTAVPVCPAGQQPTLSGSCETCPPHTYKDTTGPQKCTACPHKSYQPKSGSSACLPCPSEADMAALLPADRAVVEQGCVKRNVSTKPGKPEVGTVQATGIGSQGAAGKGVVPSWGAEQKHFWQKNQAYIVAFVLLLAVSFFVAAWWVKTGH